MNLEKYIPRKILLATGLIFAGSLALMSCGEDDSGPAAPSVPSVEVLKPEVVNDPDIENYKIVKISNYWAGTGYTKEPVGTYQESYDYQDKHWECSVSVSGGDKSGGIAKSCITSEIAK